MAHPKSISLTAKLEIDLTPASALAGAGVSGGADGQTVLGAAADSQAAGQEKPPLSRFSMVAYTGGPMRLAGWRYPVVVDLAGLAIPSQSRPIRFGPSAGSTAGPSRSA